MKNINNIENKEINSEKEILKENNNDNNNDNNDNNDNNIDNDKNYPFTNKVSNIYSIHKFISFFIRGSIRVFIILIFTVIFLVLMYISNKYDKSSFKKNIKKYYCYFLLYFLSFKNINIKNYEKITNSKSNIIFSNHSSIIDVLVLMYLIPQIRIVIDRNEKMDGLYFFNDILDDFIIYSDKLDEEDTIKILNNKNIKLLFFSEGCLSRCDILLKLQDNAFKLKKSILPIYLKYEETSMWIDSNLNIYDYIFDLLSRNRSILDINILDDFNYNTEEDIIKNIENFRKNYSKTTGVRLSNLSYKDHPYFKNNNN